MHGAPRHNIRRGTPARHDCGTGIPEDHSDTTLSDAAAHETHDWRRHGPSRARAPTVPAEEDEGPAGAGEWVASAVGKNKGSVCAVEQIVCRARERACWHSLTQGASDLLRSGV